jgi:hypothetical protein
MKVNFLKPREVLFKEMFKNKNLSQFLHKIYYIVVTGVTLIPIFQKFAMPKIVALMGNHFWN